MVVRYAGMVVRYAGMVVRYAGVVVRFAGMVVRYAGVVKFSGNKPSLKPNHTLNAGYTLLCWIRDVFCPQYQRCWDPTGNHISNPDVAPFFDS